MKKKIIALGLALALCLGLLPAVFAADTRPEASSNKNKQDYSTYGSTVKSYLYENSSGGLTRVEYINGKVVVEDYDSSFQLQSSRQISAELPIWGGFYAGQDYNFLIFGQNNLSENNSTEVIRVVKYDKDWNRLGQTSVKGAYTKVPFDAGSLRCAEENGYLYIHCARKMHRNVMTMYGMTDTMDNHQANLTLEIRESSMELVDSYDQVWNLDFGYVSHSFNQFILIDQDKNIVTLNHADSNGSAGGKNNYGYAQDVISRGVDLIRYDVKAGQDHFQGQSASQRYQWTEFSLVQTFGGNSGNNITGASIGGFEETSTGYVSAYNYNGTGASGGDRAVYLGFTTKSGLKSSTVRVSTSGNTTTPVLASTGLNGGYVMWNTKSGYTVSDTLCYAAYDASGKAGQVKTATGSLSDCQPIQYNGRLVWYTTDNSAPVFYTLDASGVKQYTADGYPASRIREPDITKEPDPEVTRDPDPEITKDPDPEVTRDPDPEITKDPDPEVTTTPDPVPNVPVFTDVPSDHWAYPDIYECAKKGIVEGVTHDRFNPEGSVTYAEFCTMLARAFFPEEFAQWEKQDDGKIWYWAAMSAVYNNGKGLAPTVNSAASYGQDWSDAAYTKLNRYEMARIMYQLLPWFADKLDTYYSNAAAKLTDWNQLSESYREAVAVCVYYGIITGTDGGRFNGAGPMRRGQACAVLNRLDSAGASADHIDKSDQPTVTDPSHAGELYLPHSIDVLTKGSQLRLSAYVVQSDGRLKDIESDVTWTTETPGIVSLQKTSSGTVASFRSTTGTALLTASYKGQTRQLTVKLVDQSDSISLSSPWVGGMRVGETFSTQLYVFSTSKFYGKDFTVTWTLDDPSMGTLTETMANGNHAIRFVAKKTGMVQITCRVTLPDGSSAVKYCDLYIY